MKRKLLSCVALAALCAPMVVFAPPLPRNTHNAIVIPGIKYELQIGAEKHEVSHERDGFTTTDGTIINTDKGGYFLSVKGSQPQD